MEKQQLSDEEVKRIHSKKMVAPIVIAVIIGLYYIGFAAACFLVPMPIVCKLLFGMIPLVLTGVIIYVSAERIHEIRSGVEDDLSQY